MRTLQGLRHNGVGKGFERDGRRAGEEDSPLDESAVRAAIERFLDEDGDSIEEDNSLTVVLPGWTARLDGWSNIVLEREGTR